MPRRPTQQQLFDELLDRYGLKIAEAFMEAVADIRANADLQAFLAALDRSDVEAALAALHIEAAAFGPVEEAVRTAYLAGGRAGIETLPGIGRLIIGFRFDVRNPRAEAWLRDHSSRLIRSIIDQQRTAIRGVLVQAMVGSQHPRRTALEIVGRVSRATGRREGGIIGLSDSQLAALVRARRELASGDPAQLRSYLRRKLRDRRFDRSVARAIRDGQPVPADVAENATARYEARLLRRRGESIGRSESLTALRAAKQETYEQLVDSGEVPELLVRRTWRSTRDLRTRDTHRSMQGQEVGLREPFKSPSGARLMYPGDTSLGAGADEIVECRCDFTVRINWHALGQGAAG